MNQIVKRILSVVIMISMCFTMISLSAFADNNSENHAHEYIQSVIAPTASEDGYTLYSCSCGDSYIDNIVPADTIIEENSDAYDNINKLSADEIIADNSLPVKQTDCGGSHNWDAGVLVCNPSPDGDGLITYTCTECGEMLDETIPYVQEYSWSYLNDEEFYLFVTSGENDDYILDLEKNVGSKEYNEFYERVAVCSYYDEIYAYIDSLVSINAPIKMMLNAPQNNTENLYSYTNPNNGLSISVSYPKVISCGIPTIFTMSASGGTGTYKYRLYSLTDESGNLIADISRMSASSYSTSNTFDFTFMASGTYYIQFSAMDMGSNTTVRTPLPGIKITIDDPAYPSVNSRVSTIADKCLQTCSTDYEKALWLHDYLINNMKYDNSFTYCSAEGALARGTGTCEAYHGAYVLLLAAVGMQWGRIVSNGHVWTAVKMDGEWYQVDTTWDDVNDYYGYESHLLFGVNDEIMALVHDEHTANAGFESNALDNNWIYKSGKVSQWTDEFRQTIKDNIASKIDHFEIEISGAIPANYRNVVYNVTAYALNKENWGTTVDSLNATYSDYGNNVYGGSVKGGKLVFDIAYAIIDSGTCGNGITWTVNSGGCLSISGNGDMLFEADVPWKDYLGSITAIAISDGITGIADNSFKSCEQLSSISIPATITTIGSKAFDGCTALKTISFLGNAPVMSSDSFSNVTAKALYPDGNSTWTENNMLDYGGTLTWREANAVDVYIESASIGAGSTVYVDGRPYEVKEGNTITLPKGSNPKVITTYSYYSPSADVHTQYPSSMEVYLINSNSEELLIATHETALSNCLQYKGTSIRITGVKGIRVITGIPTTLKNTLTSSGVNGYVLEEYGTMLAWRSNISESSPLIFGTSNVLSNYAYKKGVADPVYKTSNGLTQFTNVVTFGNDMSKCVNDLTLRPYMILSKGDEKITIYGGVLNRNIGYVANQNKNAFAAGTDAYNYIWNIINYVYPKGYSE